MTTRHYRPYQLECPTCRGVAALHVRADLLRPHIDGFLPRSALFCASTDQLTPKQQVAAHWSSAISDCLRIGMAAHLRCRSCTILMGPGHSEPGIEGFCATHGAKAALEPVALRDDEPDVLSWIAGNSQAARV